MRSLPELRRVGRPTVVLGAAGYGVALGAGLAALGGLGLPINVPASLPTLALYSAGLLLSSWLANQGHTAFLAALWALGASALLLGLSPPLFAALTALALLFPAFHTLADPRSYR